MDYITFRINYTMDGTSGSSSEQLPYPKTFEMQVVPNIVNEIHTMSGNVLYDVNGWKYADTTIEWGTLYPEMLERLIQVVNKAKVNDLFIEYIDPKGEAKPVKTVIRNFKKAKTLARYGSDYVWEGVSLQLTFPECFQYTPGIN